MNTVLLQIAERILCTSDREHPADAVLRQELKSRRDLSPAQATIVSRAVFSYYRWLGWLSEPRPTVRGIEQGLELADRFALKPAEFSDSELVGRAVPGWVRNQMDVSPAWVRALQAGPVLWLRARRGCGPVLVQALGDCRAFGNGCLPDVLEYRGSRDLFLTPEFHAGEFEIQDVSSQAVGLLCAPKAGETWWDACAGEGGKTLHLSELMENRGLIWATDKANWRLKRLKRRAARARVFNFRTALWGGGTKLPTRTKFDGVLVDAPCSGIGTWQRNPHARWTASPQDIFELSGLQKQLLRHAAPAVKPGGKMLYAVCTTARSETSEVVQEFERQFPQFRPLPVANPLDGNASPSAPTWFWPQQVAGNGMFVAAWRNAAGR